MNITPSSILEPVDQIGDHNVQMIISPESILSEEVFGDNGINQKLLDITSIASKEYFGNHEVVRKTRVVQSIAKVVRNQPPQYVQSDFPKFLDLLEKYYEFMESSGNALHLSKHLLEYQDADTSTDPFFSGLRKEVMSRLPKQLYVDPVNPNNKVNIKNVLKNIVHFYGAKGTEKSFEYLFRILLGVDVDFYYPRTDMLRCSDGKWIQNYSVRVTSPNNSTGTPFDFSNRVIRGLASQKEAFVEYVISFEIGFQTVYELYLNISSLTGDFFVGEDIISDEIPGVIANPVASVTSFTLYDRGQNYTEGSTVNSNFGLFGVQEFTGVVSTVNAQGNVLKVDVIDPGFNIPENAFETVDANDRTYGGVLTYSSDGDDELHVIPQVGTVIRYKGFYLNDDGKLSDAKYIQDSYFYQQFSYVLKVSESFETYKNFVLELLHPTGLKLFGQFVSENAVDLSPSVYGDTSYWSIKTQGFAEYEIPVEQDSEITLNIVLDGNVKPEFEVYQLQSLVKYQPGASYSEIDKLKFTYKPKGGNDEDRMNHLLNSSYWDSEYANYQIKDFFDLIVGDMWNDPGRQTKIQPEPTIKTATSPALIADYDMPSALP